MSKIERTVRIRQFMGGVYPRLILDSPFVSLRGAKGDEAISVGTGDCHASLAMTAPFRRCEADFSQPKQSRGRVMRLSCLDKSGLAMTTSFCRCEALSPSCRCEALSPSCRCEADEVSRSNLGGDMRLPRFARNDRNFLGLKETWPKHS